MNKFFANWDLDQLLENIKDMGKSLGALQCVRYCLFTMC